MNNIEDKHKTKSKTKGSTILQGQEIRKVFKVGKNLVEVLKGIDIAIDQGEFLILFGSSGCGKSTLLNTLLGLEIPTSGKVNFMGKDLYTYDEDDRSQIRKEGVGFIYQQQNWIKSLNVLENVAFPLTLMGVMKEERELKAMDKLKEVHMEGSSDQAPTELSSGQQQKVSFARALIANPAIVVADEPTGNLDSKSGIELMQMFAEYNNKGNTIIMVTHDLGFLSYATRVVNMSDGVIVGEYMAGDKELNQFKLHNKK
jgi:putative ABC transport system ATP-binding protein